MTWLLIALGAAVGSCLRYVAGHLGDRAHDRSQPIHRVLPWGTLAVNLAGSFLIGWLSASSPGEWARAGVATGLCGGLTTFSALSVQSHDRGTRSGGLYLLLTVPPAIVLCALGYALSRSLGTS